MSRPRMRPTFSADLDCRSAVLMAAFERNLATEAEYIEGEFSKHHGVLRIPPADRRFWTPSLDLTIEDKPLPEGDAHARLWGTFSPRAEVWQLFVFATGTLIIVSVFAGMFGIAQLALGTAPYALAIPLFAGLVAGGLYLSALIGQGLSISEMYRLRAFVDDCIREAEHERSCGAQSKLDDVPH